VIDGNVGKPKKSLHYFLIANVDPNGNNPTKPIPLEIFLLINNKTLEKENNNLSL
jgi:hypothetical protein